MSQSKLNNRQRKERWDQAVELAKKGQYSKVRFVLQDMHDEPRVRKLLKKIDGRSDKLQGGITGFFNVVLVIIVLVGIALIAIVWNFTQNFDSARADRSALLAQYEARGLSGSRALFGNFITMCMDATNDNADGCVDWSADVLTNYSQVVPVCTLTNEDGSIAYGAQTNETIAVCLMEQGVPPFPPSL